jgi:hypothetical protein
MKSKFIFITHILSTIYLIYTAWVLSYYPGYITEFLNFLFSIFVFIVIFILAFKVELLDEQREVDEIEKRRLMSIRRHEQEDN